MSCALTQGIEIACRTTAGGIKNVYILPFASVDYDAPVNGVIATSGATWFNYQLPANSSQFTSTTTRVRESGVVSTSTELTIVIPKLEASLLQELKLLTAQRLGLVIQDRLGTFWVMGYENGVEVTTAVAGSGTAIGDMNGLTITFMSDETTPLYELTTEPTATF